MFEICLAEAKERRVMGVGPCVAVVFGRNCATVYVQTRHGVWFRIFEPAYVNKYSDMGCLRKVLVNDFYGDQDMWCRSSRAIPGNAFEVNK